MKSAFIFIPTSIAWEVVLEKKKHNDKLQDLQHIHWNKFLIHYKERLCIEKHFEGVGKAHCDMSKAVISEKLSMEFKNLTVIILDYITVQSSIILY